MIDFIVAHAPGSFLKHARYVRISQEVALKSQLAKLAMMSARGHNSCNRQKSQNSQKSSSRNSRDSFQDSMVIPCLPGYRSLDFRGIPWNYKRFTRFRVLSHFRVLRGFMDQSGRAKIQGVIIRGLTAPSIVPIQPWVAHPRPRRSQEVLGGPRKSHFHSKCVLKSQ